MDMSHALGHKMDSDHSCQMEFLQIILGDAGQSVESRTSWGWSGSLLRGFQGQWVTWIGREVKMSQRRGW